MPAERKSRQKTNQDVFTFPQSDHANKFANNNGVHPQQLHPSAHMQGGKKELQTADGHLNLHKMKAVKMSFEMSPNIYLFGDVCHCGHFLALPKKIKSYFTTCMCFM